MKLKLLFAFIMISANLAIARSNSYSIGDWSVSAPKTEKVFAHIVNGTPVLAFFEGGAKESTFFYKKTNPVSVRTSKALAKFYGADPNSISVKKMKKNTVFRFKTPDGYLWLSTKGGQLTLVSSNPSNREVASIVEGVTWSGK